MYMLGYEEELKGIDLNLLDMFTAIENPVFRMS